MSGHNRRGFFQQSAALGAGIGLGLTGKAVAANDKINVACIGVRGRGNSVMNSFVSEADCHISHTCDIRQSVREQRGAQIKEKTGHMPRLVNDYRTLLNDKSIDAFMVATPDHWHAKVAIEALRAGKDVYCEKPMTLTIDEGRQICETVRETNQIVQIGTQQRSQRQFVQAVALARAGRLGTLRRVSCSVGGGPISPELPVVDPPANVNWNRWQGPVVDGPCHSLAGPDGQT